MAAGPWLGYWGRLKRLFPDIIGSRVESDDAARQYLRSHGYYEDVRPAFVKAPEVITCANPFPSKLPPGEMHGLWIATALTLPAVTFANACGMSEQLPPLKTSEGVDE